MQAILTLDSFRQSIESANHTPSQAIQRYQLSPPPYKSEDVRCFEGYVDLSLLSSTPSLNLKSPQLCLLFFRW